MDDHEIALEEPTNGSVESTTSGPGPVTEERIREALKQVYDPELGISELEQATQMDPYLVAAWVPYLHALFLSGDVDRFIPEAARAGAMFPKDAPVQGMYGLALVLGGSPDQAQPVLEAALADDPFIPFANHALGTLMKERGDTAKAESFLQEEIRLHPPAIPARRPNRVGSAAVGCSHRRNRGCRRCFAP